MAQLWIIILSSVYLALVVTSLIYYMIISIKKRERFTDSFLLNYSSEPSVSIIVPTFNEEKNIVKCLQTLHSLNYSNYEIIVSDGGSSDNTVALAKPLADQIVIENDLPKGWIGKNYGCHIASSIASGEILLFTDADTRHTPNSLRIAVSKLLEKKAALLTMFPYQKIKRWWESIVPIYFFLSLFVSGGIKRVNDPKEEDNFVAVGQYLMFTREAYDKIGGHERLKGSIIEDYAFARVVKKQLHALYFMDSSRLIYSQMYPDSFVHCWTGLKKFLYAGVKLTPPRRIFATLLFIFWALLSPIMLILTGVFSSSIGLISAMGASYAALIVIFIIYWHRKGKHHWLTYLLFPIQIYAFIVLMLSSFIEYTFKKTTIWKGRKYHPDLSAGLDDYEELHSEATLITPSQPNQ